MTAMERLHFVCVTGMSASGKDYQSELLVKNMPNAVAISPGDLMRKAKDPENKNHSIIKPHLNLLKVGGIFPSEVTMGILAEEIEECLERGMRTFVLTGFPRNEGNINAFDEYLIGIRNRFDNVRDDQVYLDIDEADAHRRRDLRVAGYARKGDEIRDDDLPGVMEKKMVVFNEEVMPIVNRLIAEGRMVVVNARGSKTETQRELRRLLMWDQLYPVENGLPPQARK